MTVQRRQERVLLVEDDAPLRRALGEVLAANGYDVTATDSGVEALTVLEADGADAVITDLDMPRMAGAELLARVRGTRPEVPVVVITAFGSVESAVELTHAGAADYLAKPFRTQDLLDKLSRVLDTTRDVREQRRVQRSFAPHLHGLVGTSPPMLRLFERIGRVAPSSEPVLITGETGTGKELVARAVHHASGRATFVAVNCGAIPEHLIEAELFGHARGAFTGATRERAGLFEAADGGTLFLDEIGELPLSLQPKLLRVLESGELRRVGEVAPRRVSVRLIAATHRDLEAALQGGEFREDLYWRINVLHLEVPSLRERPTDVALLVEHFCRGGRGGEREVAPDAIAALRDFAWPGNVRQLRSVLERAFTFGSGGTVECSDLPEEIRESTATRRAVQSAVRRGLTLAELEREYTLEVLRSLSDNKTKAAEWLGIPRRTLYRRLEEYGRDAGV